MRRVMTVAGDTANTLLYRELGRSDDDAEEALWLLNPGLAARGPVLPAGLRVALPEIDKKPAVTVRASAWD